MVQKQIRDLGIEVKYGVKVDDVTKLGADEVVVATGAVARRFNVPGVEKQLKRATSCSAKSKLATTSLSSAVA